MARPKQLDDDKIQSLKKYGALNPHPQKVAEKMFADSTNDFFDPRDLVQVKYEMLRAVEKEGYSVKQAPKPLGFSDRHTIRQSRCSSRRGLPASPKTAPVQNLPTS